jgi:hypothetical protein
MALLTATLNCAAESFPVVHNEPITVRILGGKDGKVLVHMHLVLIGGYDQRDLHDQLYRAEMLTDARGQVRLTGQLASLPWLQVWVGKKSLCQTKPRGASFSVELIRRDGLSAPNRCGTATVEDTPGVFTVFVKGKGKNAVAIMSVARTEAPAAEVVRTSLPAKEVPVRKTAEVETRPSAAQNPSVTAILPAAPTPAPEEAVLKTVAPKPVVTAAPAIASAPTTTLTTAPAAVAARGLTSGHARTAAYRPVRQASRRPVSHRAKPVLASCSARQPAANARSEDKPATAIKTTHKAKPEAGVKLVTVTPGTPTAPPKQ